LLQDTELRQGSEAYNTWLNAPAPIYVNFYFFSLTNTEFIDKSALPHVRQIGPYVYREVRNKTEVERINGGATLRYRQQKWYVFDVNRSHGSENDTFTTINIPLLVSQFALSYDSKVKRYKMFSKPRGPLDSFSSSQLDTSNNMVHHVVCLFTCQLLNQYQVILLVKVRDCCNSYHLSSLSCIIPVRQQYHHPSVYLSWFCDLIFFLILEFFLLLNGLVSLCSLRVLSDLTAINGGDVAALVRCIRHCQPLHLVSAPAVIIRPVWFSVTMV